MNAWSRSEAARTIEEVKRRSATDPEFRALALSNPEAALAKVNPRPIPHGSVRFVEFATAGQKANDTEMIETVLPNPVTTEDELSDEDLENAAGGGNAPPVGIS